MINAAVGFHNAAFFQQTAFEQTCFHVSEANTTQHQSSSETDSLFHLKTPRTLFGGQRRELDTDFWDNPNHFQSDIYSLDTDSKGKPVCKFRQPTMLFSCRFHPDSLLEQDFVTQVSIVPVMTIEPSGPVCNSSSGPENPVVSISRESPLQQETILKFPVIFGALSSSSRISSEWTLNRSFLFPLLA